jgi:hypothetical protein
MNNLNFKNEYIEWLKLNTEEVLLGKNIKRLTTPFLDINNDYIEIYIARSENGFILTDNGDTISNLELDNVRFFDNSKRKDILNTIVRSHDVRLSDDEQLWIECSIDNFGLKANSLMQCMIKVSDMLMLSDTSVKTIFTEEVRRYFDENNIIYVADMNLLGKSSYYANYDFCLPKSKDYPERFIKPINHVTESIIKSAIFTWDDVKGNRSNDALLYVIINDKQKKAESDSTKALSEYGIGYILWSQIKNNLNLLRSQK